MEILHHINPLIILKHFVTKSHHDHHQIIPLKLKSEERWNHSLPNELKSACWAAITVRRRSAISGFFLTRACVPGVTPASCFLDVRWSDGEKVRVSWRSYDFHVKSVLISCQLSNCLNQENCSGLQRLSCTEPILKMAPKVRKAAYLVSNVGLRGLFRALTTLSFDPFKSQGQHAQVPIKLPCLWMPFSVGHICTVVTHLVLTDPVVYRYHVWGTVTCWFVCN